MRLSHPTKLKIKSRLRRLNQVKLHLMLQRVTELKSLSVPWIPMMRQRVRKTMKRERRKKKRRRKKTRMGRKTNKIKTR